jgi:hypothetical protein
MPIWTSVRTRWTENERGTPLFVCEFRFKDEPVKEIGVHITAPSKPGTKSRIAISTATGNTMRYDIYNLSKHTCGDLDPAFIEKWIRPCVEETRQRLAAGAR